LVWTTSVSSSINLWLVSFQYHDFRPNLYDKGLTFWYFRFSQPVTIKLCLIGCGTM
jgi:hypothetical protein